VKGSARGKPNIAACCTSASIQNWSPRCGPTIGRPRSRASCPVPPAWSMWACVSQICCRSSPSAPAVASRRGTSPPGSMTAAAIVSGHQTSEQFCWNGVTGMVL